MISVIIVNFNAGAYLLAAVESVLAQREPGCEIIVVDNRSDDGSIARLRETFPDAENLRIIVLDRNVGFASACNVGLAAARGGLIAFINPDCRLYAGSLAALKSVLDHTAEAGMAGPRILNPDGSEQRGARRDIPNPWQIFCVACQLHRLMPNHPRFRGFNRNAEPLPDKAIEVQAVSGACMLVRRAAISEVGSLDGEYFLHFEDLDWCLRFTAAGWKVMFVPGAVVEHTQGVCSRRSPLQVAYAKHRSLVRFLRKHFTSYYPSSFMAFVTGLVMARFVLVAAMLTWRQVSGVARLPLRRREVARPR